MIFYANETCIALLLASIPAFIAIYCFVYLHKTKFALLFLGISAFLIRLLMTALDPFLQEWDERFHALVAKNMIQYPFKPMLMLNPVLQYDYTEWCCNHIWVHKQPLFLWQMALSMKLFGVNEIAMRLPSAILSTFMVFAVYQIAEFWIKQKSVAFIAAIIYTFSYYQLELVSGKLSLDHNDLIFTCYVTFSIWAFTQYLKYHFDLKWALAIGFFVGCAVLNKWLTGFLVYGAWGIYILFGKNEVSFIKKMTHIATSVIVACIVFIPWQLYILKAFPLESAWEFEFNRKHIFEVLQGHEGGFLYHIEQLSVIYSGFLIPFLVVGIWFVLRKKEIDRLFTISILSIIVVIYSFFSIIVKTKMPAFVYPIAAPISILMALGLYEGFTRAFVFVSKNRILKHYTSSIKFLTLILIAFFCLKPFSIIKSRSVENESRNVRIHNTKIFKSLDPEIDDKYIVLNLKPFENVEMQFYQNVNAYDWYCKSEIIDSLHQKGYQFAAYKSHQDQILPKYITDNPKIKIINQEFH